MSGMRRDRRDRPTPPARPTAALVLAAFSLAAAALGCNGGPRGAEAFTRPAVRSTESTAGVSIDVITEGSGPAAAAGQWVRVHYRVRLAADQTVVDSSHARDPLLFRLDGDTNLIDGFHEAVRGMRSGELRRAHVPQHLGYGDRAIGRIPARADLVFELEMMTQPE